MVIWVLVANAAELETSNSSTVASFIDFIFSPFVFFCMMQVIQLEGLPFLVRLQQLGLEQRVLGRVATNWG